MQSAEERFLIFELISMKKYFGVITFSLFSFIIFGSISVLAAGPSWDISGTWNIVFDVGGTPYLHTMNVTLFNTLTGEFIANGFYNPDPSYTWNATGTVSSNLVSFHVVYTGTNSGYSFDVAGTIAGDGFSMSGVWDLGTWAGTGQATGLARLTVNKVVINDNGGSNSVDDFDLFINGNPVLNGSSTIVIVGTYIVSETPVLGYVGTIGGDCDSQGVIVLSPGDDKICTITNDDEPGHIIVQKTTHPSSEQTEFAISATGTGAVLNGENGTTTDAIDYEYLVNAGTYFVTETVPAGWIMLSNSCQDMVIEIGQTLFCEIVNLKLGEIHGVKFEDLNGNGQKDQGEPGMSGWTIYLDSNNNGQFDLGEISTQTSQNGSYAFTNLMPGQYNVREVLPASGWSQTLPVNNGKYVVDIFPGTISQDNDFGNFQWNLITGFKWHDLNGDGIWQQNEPPLEGWPIELHRIIQRDPQGSPIETELVALTLTGGDGSFRLYGTGVAHFGYGLKEKRREGWIQTAPEVSSFFDVFFEVFVTQSGQTHTTDNQQRSLNFGNFELNKITGYKWEDINGDGIWQQGEPPISLWKIKLDGKDRDGNIIHRETFTDINGRFSFFDVFVNFQNEPYKITEENKNGWIGTYPTSSFFDVFVELSGVEHTTDHNNLPLYFGNFRLGEIRGTKFEDVDRNGRRGSAEPGLAGWTIQLTGFDEITQQNVNLATTTDYNGRYSFTGLTKGTYTVTEVGQQGWSQTAPSSGSYTLTIDTSGRVYAGKDFGNFRLKNFHGRKYHDVNRNRRYDNGEPLLQGWTIELMDMMGGARLRTTTDINGEYVFLNVMPGKYFLREIVEPGWKAWSPRTGFYLLKPQSSDTLSYDFGNIPL